ncbi:MAG TPA: CRISPR-associated protein Csx19 [Ktedonosporobacter sp.]|nr:CRISPR-associated protein Csx19 [Ktedonosporobacter sp.]
MPTYEEEGGELMEEILATGPVSDIAALIKACDFPQEAFILTENFPSYRVNDQRGRQNLLRFARLEDGLAKDGFDVNHTTAGRVFHKKFELRWEKRDHQYWVVYLGTPRKVPGLIIDNAPLAGLKAQEGSKRYYLFGEVLDPEDPDERKAMNIKAMGIEERKDYYTYAEVRIPRLLRYPPPLDSNDEHRKSYVAREKAKRVQLVICEYIDKTTGSVQLFRFQNLEPEPEEKQ